MLLRCKFINFQEYHFQDFNGTVGLLQNDEWLPSPEN